MRIPVAMNDNGSLRIALNVAIIVVAIAAIAIAGFVWIARQSKADDTLPVLLVGFVIAIAMLVTVVALALLAWMNVSRIHCENVVADGLSRLQNILYVVAVRVGGAMAAGERARFTDQERGLVARIVAGEAGKFLVYQRSERGAGAQASGESWRLFFLLLNKATTSSDLREQVYELLGMLDLLGTIEPARVRRYARHAGQVERMVEMGRAIRDDVTMRVMRSKAAHEHGRSDRDAERFLAAFDPSELEEELAYLGPGSLERKVYDSARREAEAHPELGVVLVGVIQKILEGRRARLSLFATNKTEDSS